MRKSISLDELIRDREQALKDINEYTERIKALNGVVLYLNKKIKDLKEEQNAT